MTTETPTDGDIQETVIDESNETEVNAEVEVEETTAERTEEEIALELEAEKKRKSSEKTQKRINQLTREKKEAQAEAQKLKDELAKYSKPQEPDPDNYDTQDEYINAKVAYEVSKATTSQHAPSQQGVDIQHVLEAGRAKYQDFDAVALNNDLPLSQEMAEMIAEADNADDMFYHLGKNPVELERISLLDPNTMARELGRLEARLSIPKPRTTNTPAPIKPIDTADAQAPNYANETMEQYAARRNKEAQAR